MKQLVILWITIGFLYGCNFSEKKKNDIGQNGNRFDTSQDPLKESIARGENIYSDFCMQCHMADGLGVKGIFPPLAKSNWLTEKRTESIHAIKFGQRGRIEVNGEIYNSIMVPMGLTDEEIADVLNYVMNSWGNTQKNMVTEAEVAKVSKE